MLEVAKEVSTTC